MGTAARQDKRARAHEDEESKRDRRGGEASERVGSPRLVSAAMAAPPLNAAAAAAAAAGSPRVPFSRGDLILALVAPYLSFADRLALRLVCRDWRRSCRRLGGVAPPPFPWLMLPPLAATRGAAAAAPAAPRRRFYDIPGGRAYAYHVPAYHRCVASGGGWLVLAAVDPPRRLVLANPVTGARRVLAWPFGEKGSEGIRAVLTSSPADPACFLAVATDRLIAYCRPGRAGGGWATLRAPGYRHDTVASDMVAVGSAVYLVDERRKVWRADLAAAEPKVERRDTAFALPHAGEGEEDGRWGHYLVAAFGHVHLVVSDERHRRVALFRLSWHPRTWVPTSASLLGDRVLLLGHGCSAAVPASAAAGRAPGTVLFARQPWDPLHVASSIRHPCALQWFWSELRLDAGVGDPIVMRKTVPHWPGFFHRRRLVLVLPWH